MKKFSVIVIITISFFSCKKSNLLILSPTIEKELCESTYLNKSLKNDKYTVTTFIDTTIQNTSKKALFDVLKQLEAESGFVMVMETKTGQIKAMTSFTNKNSAYIPSHIIDATIPIEPGSLIKTFDLMSLLEDKKATTSSIYNANGGEVFFYNQKIKDYQKGTNEMSLRNAFLTSSNTIFAQAIQDAYKENPTQLMDNLNKFGLTADLDLPLNTSKNNSTLPNPKSDNWSKITLPWMGIGYGLSLTPTQILTYYNTIGNNGIMVQPLFLSKIISNEGSSKEYSTTILNNEICSKATISTIQDLLKIAVSTNSKKLQISGQAAEITLDYADQNKSKKTASTFVGYFARKNSEYTMMVYIKNPKKELPNKLNIAEKLFGELVEKIK